MEASIIVAAIAAFATIGTAAITYSFTKRKEREADWRKYKYEQYKEFVAAIAAIAGPDAAPADRRQFVLSSNTLHLVGSKGVLDALHKLLNSYDQQSRTERDACLNKLVWEIRRDLKIPQTSSEDEFRVRLSAYQANEGES